MKRNKPMSDKAAAQWTADNYPRHVAARTRQAATHERAVQRKLAFPSKILTKKQLTERRAILARAAKRAARQAKHARKVVCTD